MRKVVYGFMVIALLSLSLGTMVTFSSGYLFGRITPRALLIFSGVCLLFGINFALVELMKK